MAQADVLVGPQGNEVAPCSSAAEAAQDVQVGFLSWVHYSFMHPPDLFEICFLSVRGEVPPTGLFSTCSESWGGAGAESRNKKLNPGCHVGAREPLTLSQDCCPPGCARAESQALGCGTQQLNDWDCLIFTETTENVSDHDITAHSEVEPRQEAHSLVYSLSHTFAHLFTQQRAGSACSGEGPLSSA